MVRQTAIGLLVIMVFLMPSFHPQRVWAANSEVSPLADMDYNNGVGRKLGRGASNTAFGWMELLKGIQDVGEQNGFFAAITWGPFYGLGKSVVRSAAGVYEMATFPIPVPRNFQPLVQPEFVLGEPQ